MAYWLNRRVNRLDGVKLPMGGGMKNPTSRRVFKEGFCIVAVFAFFAAILWATDIQTVIQANQRSTCRTNLKHIALAVKQYQNDWDERYPNVYGAAGTGWAYALHPYLPSTQVLQCPSDANPSARSPLESGYSDYWYNANFMIRFERDGKVIYRVCSGHGPTYQERNILLGDGGTVSASRGHDSTYNQCGDGSSLTGPNQICRIAKSLIAVYPAAQIHLNGANFAFADGHVKWIKSDIASQSTQIMSNRATVFNIGHKYTFSLLPPPSAEEYEKEQLKAKRLKSK
jgi:prepilin-type processing-associated H-X9-DG protein